MLTAIDALAHELAYGAARADIASMEEDSMTDGNERFEAWAIVELFGHQRIAGKLTEQTIGGCNFIRVDVPAFEDSPAFTKLYTQGAIYAVTFVSEQIARAAAQSYRVAPVSVYELRHMMEAQGKLLASPAEPSYDDEPF